MDQLPNTEICGVGTNEAARLVGMKPETLRARRFRGREPISVEPNYSPDDLRNLLVGERLMQAGMRLEPVGDIIRALKADVELWPKVAECPRRVFLFCVSNGDGTWQFATVLAKDIPAFSTGATVVLDLSDVHRTIETRLADLVRRGMRRRRAH